MRRYLWVMVGLALAGLLLGVQHNRYAQQGTGDTLAQTVRGIVVPLQKGVYAVSAGLVQFFNTLVSAQHAIADQHRLLEENARLRQELKRMRALQRENETMRTLLKVRPELPHEWLGCRVIALYPQQQTLILDRGTRDGILPGAPVVCGEGLVGVVAQADAGSAIVRLLTAPRVAVSARVLNSSRVSSGFCEGRGESEILLHMLPPEAPVQVGDSVVSAGLGGKYPSNIPIGVVVQVWLDRQYSLKKARVRPYADFENLQIVLVQRKEHRR